MIGAKALADLGWSDLVEALCQRTATVRGRELAARCLPELPADEAARTLAAVEDVRAAVSQDDAPPLGGIADIRPLVARAAKEGVLEPQELVDVATTLRGLSRLGRWLDGAEGRFEGVVALTLEIPDLFPVVAAVERCFDPPDQLRDDASPHLAVLREEVAALHDRLRRRIEQFLADHDYDDLLQDRFWSVRGDRYVLPIKTEFQGRVPGIVHDTSQTGQTVFVEPQPVVSLNNRLKMSAGEMAREERRILSELSARVGARASEIERASTAAAVLDDLVARARLADDLNATAPVVLRAAEDRLLELRQARHPLLVLESVEVVSNDLSVGGDGARVLLVSGPNAGGKTIALKTVGLAVLMTRAGLPVTAASGSRVPAFDVLVTDVGDDQDLTRDLSTFSAHLLNLKRGLADAGPEALLLLDEIGAGTEPSQGAALAGAVLEALAERGSTVVATTHDGRLKALAAGDPHMQNASFSLDPDTHRPTYRMHVGVAGLSGAFELAESMGLDAAVVERAKQLAGEGGELERALSALARERDAMEKARALAEGEHLAVLRERDKLQRARKQLQERERGTLSGKRRELGDAVERFTAELRSLEKELKRPRRGAPTRADAIAGRELLHRARQADREVAVEIAETRQVDEGPPLSEEELTVGARVRVAGSGVVGVVRDLGARRVVLDVLGKTLEVAPVSLRRASAGAGATGASTGAAVAIPDPPPDLSPAPRKPTPRASWNTVDVRGQRVDDAMLELERFLDEGLRKQWATLYIIHGHGTGALKSATRELLDARGEWCQWEPGARDDGGDGVTVVHLL